MAANVIVLDAAQWAVLEPLLGRLGDGGILVPPDVAQAFEREKGFPVPDGDLIEYDFGGDPDVWVDVMYTTDGLAAEAVAEHVEGPVDEDEDVVTDATLPE